MAIKLNRRLDSTSLVKSIQPFKSKQKQISAFPSAHV